MIATLPSGCADPSTTTPSTSFCFKLSTSVRNCPRSSSSARCVKTFTPFTSTARETASSKPPAADFIRISSISRRSFFNSSSCAANFALNPSGKLSGDGKNCPATFANSKSFLKESSDPIPLIASILLTPLDTDSSPVTFSNPISPVAAVCVPPHSSVENPSDNFTTLTLSPYFSPNSAIAWYSFTATSMGTSTSVSTFALASTSRFTMSSISCNSSSATCAKCEKSNLSRSGATNDPACFTCVPSPCLSAACSKCVPVWLRRIASRLTPSTTVFTRSPTARSCFKIALCALTPCTGSTQPTISATMEFPSTVRKTPVSPICPPESP